MCGRFQFSVDQCPTLAPIRQQLTQRHPLPHWSDEQIAPSDRAPVLLPRQGTVVPELLTWGFPWPGRQSVIHARAETLLERPMFREAAMYQRCIVPASSFYERDAEHHQFRFWFSDKRPIYMAAVWDRRSSMDCFCIITTEANASVHPIHDRMPLLLSEELLQPWLFDSDAVATILHTTQPALESARADGQLQLW